MKFLMLINQIRKYIVLNIKRKYNRIVLEFQTRKSLKDFKNLTVLTYSEQIITEKMLERESDKDLIDFFNDKIFVYDSLVNRFFQIQESLYDRDYDRFSILLDIIINIYNNDYVRIQEFEELHEDILYKRKLDLANSTFDNQNEDYI